MALKLVWIEYLDPVAVWVLNKGQSLHLSFVGLLYEFNSKLFKTFAGLVNIRDDYSDVSVAPWFFVSIVIVKIWIVFSSPVAVTLVDAITKDITKL